MRLDYSDDSYRGGRGDGLWAELSRAPAAACVLDQKMEKERVRAVADSRGRRPPSPYWLIFFQKAAFFCVKGIYFVVRVCDKRRTELINCVPPPPFSELFDLPQDKRRRKCIRIGKKE